MTREEVLKLIQHKLDLAVDDALIMSDKEYEVFKVCEKALEQESCDDCVSRKALIERINNAEDNFIADHQDEMNDGDSFCDGIMSAVFNIREMVVQAPSVTPAHKTGYWKRMSDLPIEQDDRWKCSRCGNVIHCKSKINLRTFFGWDARCGEKMEVK